MANDQMDQQTMAQLLPLLLQAKMQQGGGLGGFGQLQAVQAQDPVAAGNGASVGSLLGTLPQAPPTSPSYAPSGRNINFFGGSPFPAEDRTRQILAGLTLGSRVLEVIKAAKKGADKGKTAAGGTSNG